MKKLRAVWHSNDNYGDALTPFIIKELYGIAPKRGEPTDIKPTFMVTGSILGEYISNSIIWGPGIMYDKPILPKRYPRPTENFRLIAVRGPISFRKSVQAGYTPLCYGDPALLLPRMYNPERVIKHRIGLIPSSIEYSKVKHYASTDTHIINVMRPVKQVINEILSCEIVLSSALHGLITAVAYGVPTKWVEFSDLIAGDGIKYKDFLRSIKLNYKPLDLRDPRSITRLHKRVFEHRLDIDLQKLWDVCPFRQTQISSSESEAP